MRSANKGGSSCWGGTGANSPTKKRTPRGPTPGSPPPARAPRHGEATVFFARMLPIIRTFISLPAGAARMPFWRFTIFTLLGCIPWVFLLTFIGKQAGANWKDWKDGFHYVDYAVLALIVVGLAWLIVRARRRRAGAPA